LGLFSDSSYRFERGVNPEGVAIASARAVELILQVAGGTAEPTLLVSGKCPERGKVSLRHSRVRDLLGMPIVGGSSDMQRNNLASLWRL
jgi:phenylalanyl-tRNA synthetase beta chain